MSTVIENIDSLFSVKSDIRQAIADKGVDMTSVPFTSFAAKIGEIPSGGGGADLKGIIEGTATELIDNTATYVRSSAFLQMSNLQTVSLTNVTSIDTLAFSGNVWLRTVNLPKCKTIGNSAFQSCIRLTTLSIPECETIRISAFINCSSLGGVYTFPKLKTVYDAAFFGVKFTSLDLPECEIIHKGAFNASSLTTLNIPKIKYIGSTAFAKASKLTSIIRPSTPFGIFNNAFPSSLYSKFFTDIEYGNIPNVMNSSIISGDYWNIYSASLAVLEVIDLPFGCTFPLQAMSNFKKLSSVHLGEYVGDFRYDNYYNSTFLSNCTSLVYANFPKVSSVGQSAFNNCQLLNTILLPECKGIGTYAFQNNRSLTTIDIHNVEVIGNSAFKSCYALSTISLPNIKSIGSYAFDGCSKLESVYVGFGTSSVPSIEATAFNTTPITLSTYIGRYGSIYVPMSLVNQYKTASGWKTFSSRIVGI